jgi:hypothetical protein
MGVQREVSKRVEDGRSPPNRPDFRACPRARDTLFFLAGTLKIY